VRKYTFVILNQLNSKKIKLTDNFEKIHNKKKYVGNDPQWFKEKKSTKLNYQPA
jgi:hypothetical protein